MIATLHRHPKRGHSAPKLLEAGNVHIRHQSAPAAWQGKDYPFSLEIGEHQISLSASDAEWVARKLLESVERNRKP